MNVITEGKPNMSDNNWNVVDLFSGAGGMSYGFHTNKRFKVVAAFDAQIGKPSSPHGSLQCNSTYKLNMGFDPYNINLAKISPKALKKLVSKRAKKVDVLVAGPPCTGFSRANPNNHLHDDPRNSLVLKTAKFAIELDVNIVIIENARELLNGNFNHHFKLFKKEMENHGFRIASDAHMLTKFGLPQIRERSLIVAVREHLEIHTMDELWNGTIIDKKATTVDRVLHSIPTKADDAQRFPRFSNVHVKRRMEAIPKDGGSWIDLTKDGKTQKYLTPAMTRILEKGRIGSHPDVYGRMWLNKPAPTIKRECAHVGNGRYAHPVEDRLLTLREMACIQGFPNNYKFNGAALSNAYRHVGDAVPPLISYQLSKLCQWILSGKKPTLKTTLLKNTHLTSKDLIKKEDSFAK